MTPSPPVEVELREWESVTPDMECYRTLRGLSFNGHPGAAELAASLTQRNILHIAEGLHGISIRTRSHVGSLRIGPLALTIRPKLDDTTLLELLRYAFGLRDLHIQSIEEARVSRNPFTELLLLQLASETEELLGRGLHRQYIRQSELLASPRGRIDFNRMTRIMGCSASAALPCTHYTRSEDNLLNSTIGAGLRLGMTLTQDPRLRLRLNGLAQLIDDSADRVILSDETFTRLKPHLTRLVAAYLPAIRLIKLLHSGSGTVTLGERTATAPGFLFDMNMFFQELVGRFLKDNLDEKKYEVQAQYPMGDFFAYEKGFNPRGLKNPPVPRPDFVVWRCNRGRRTSMVAVLDTKYRDLWSKELPSYMLYQLSIYALGCDTQARQAIILYPTTDLGANEARIAIKDPFRGGNKAAVVLRPVILPVLHQALTSGNSTQALRNRQHLAETLGRESR